MPYLAAHSSGFSIGSLIGEINKTKRVIVPGNVKSQNYLALLREKKKPSLKTTAKHASK